MRVRPLGKGALVAGVLALFAPLTAGALKTSVAQAHICANQCAATSDDGMIYRVTDYTRFEHPIDGKVTAVGFSVSNHSHRSHVFQPLPGGFTAVTNTGSYVQFTDYVGGFSHCYTPHAVDPGASHPDPDQYRFKPGQTRYMKPMCMVVPAGEKLAKVQFADNDANRNAVIRLGQPRTGLPAKPGPKQKDRWPLPNPCSEPKSTLEELGGRGLTSKDLTLTRRNRNTPQASATCTLRYSGSTFYVGYVRPPVPTDGVTRTRIHGWPGAVLTVSTRPYFTDQNWFWIVTFHRRFHRHIVYGQVWYHGNSCTAAEPALARVAVPIYEAFGPGPPVSPPAPYHQRNRCETPPSTISIGTDKICPPSNPTPCQVTAAISTIETTRGRHAVSVKADRAKRVRRRVLVGRRTVRIQQGDRIVVSLKLNAKGRKLIQLFGKLPVTATVKARDSGTLATVIRRKLTIKAHKKHLHR